MTLLELIIACSILMILSSMALPVARFTVMRQREKELRQALLDMRTAIDKYKELADQQKIRVEIGTQGYPKDLATLVKGVPLGGVGTAGKSIRFLRRIPVDPMTGQADWGLRAVEDDPDSTTWSGKNVFDVYSRSTGTGMDGTKYSDW
jgi:general secretion pathway protein G